MRTHKFFPAATAVALVFCGGRPLLAEDPAEKKAILHVLDFNNDGKLTQEEVDVGLLNLINTVHKKTPKIDFNSLKGHPEKARTLLVKPPGELDFSWLSFQHQWGDPPYSVEALANNPRFMPDLAFALDKTVLEAKPTPPAGANIIVPTLVMKPVHKKPTDYLLVRRSIDEMITAEDGAIDGVINPSANSPGAAQPLGALVSYASDFNAHSQQWAVHGVVGLDFAETVFGGDWKGTPYVAHPQVTTQWIRPSVALDKVDTAGGNKDEIDALVLRLTAGQVFTGDPFGGSLFRGFENDIGIAYATDTSGERKVFGGELNFRPYRAFWKGLNFGVNSESNRPFHNPLFWIRPELVCHVEGGTVIDNAHVAVLRGQPTYCRLGGTAGVKFGFADDEGAWITKGSHFDFLTKLILHASLQYGVDVLNEGPDVDLFTASADWKLDAANHYSLSVEYRNGRSALVLQRDNRITIGLGVKY